MTMAMQTDWRYSDERMLLRQEAFLKLKKYFKLRYVQCLYEFCHDWVSQGNQNTIGIEKEFLLYVKSQGVNISQL
jgi:hypothetical protein